VREVFTSAREGGASLDILSGLVAGNFSAYWLGMVIVGLMGAAYLVSRLGMGDLMIAPAVSPSARRLRFLGMGPVTIAVDSYGPVTDNAQSVFELSVIEQVPRDQAELRKDARLRRQLRVGKHMLEENDGAGNTFKATAKPVLIGTAVVGATTMIFSHHHGADARADPEPRQALAAPPALPPRPDHGRGDDLLVHGRLDPGGEHGRLPGRGVHSRPTSSWRA